MKMHTKDYVFVMLVLCLTALAYACSTYQAVQESVKPESFKEYLLEGYGQVKAVKTVVSTITPESLSSGTNKAITVLINDKIASIGQRELSRVLDSVHNGHMTLIDARKRVRPAVSDDYTGDNPKLLSINRDLNELIEQIDAMWDAYDLAGGVLGECSIKINDLILPCENQSDIILSTLLKIQAGISLVNME